MPGALPLATIVSGVQPTKQNLLQQRRDESALLGQERGCASNSGILPDASIRLPSLLAQCEQDARSTNSQMAVLRHGNNGAISARSSGSSGLALTRSASLRAPSSIAVCCQNGCAHCERARRLDAGYSRLANCRQRFLGPAQTKTAPGPALPWPASSAAPSDKHLSVALRCFRYAIRSAEQQSQICILIASCSVIRPKLGDFRRDRLRLSGLSSCQSEAQPAIVRLAIFRRDFYRCGISGLGDIVDGVLLRVTWRVPTPSREYSRVLEPVATRSLLQLLNPGVFAPRQGTYVGALARSGTVH